LRVLYNFLSRATRKHKEETGIEPKRLCRWDVDLTGSIDFFIEKSVLIMYVLCRFETVGETA
jgi:hypothetical protein